MLESLKTKVCLSLILICSSVAASPSQATLLRGYINRTQEQSQPGVAKDIQNSSPNSAQIPVNLNSFPTAFEGRWRCVTIVTDSSLDAVEPGNEMVSEIQFQRLPDGKIWAKWNQPGWREAQSAVTAWSPSEAQIDRTDYYYGDNADGTWGARSRDRFTQVDKLKIIGQSYVDQYKNGQYLGRYRTKSVLYKTELQDTLGALEKQLRR